MLKLNGAESMPVSFAQYMAVYYAAIKYAKLTKELSKANLKMREELEAMKRKSK